MKKIPTLFTRPQLAKGDHTVAPIVTPGLEWVLEGEGVATLKWDGTPVYYDGKKWYKRYDAKKGKQPPEGSIPCQEAPNPITGHWPHWTPVKWDDPADRYICEAIRDCVRCYAQIPAGSYEAVGYGINGNPYHMMGDVLKYHGSAPIYDVPRDYDGLKDWLASHSALEGLVFWLDGEPRCKIKRTDFGFSWPLKEGDE